MTTLYDLRRLRNDILGITEIEFGSEVVLSGGIIITYNKETEYLIDTLDDGVNIGKPVKLEEVLLMLQSKHDVKLGGKNELVVKKFSGTDYCRIDLTLPPEQQKPEVIEKIIELINLK